MQDCIPAFRDLQDDDLQESRLILCQVSEGGPDPDRLIRRHNLEIAEVMGKRLANLRAQKYMC